MTQLGNYCLLLHKDYTCDLNMKSEQIGCSRVLKARGYLTWNCKPISRRRTLACKRVCNVKHTNTSQKSLCLYLSKLLPFCLKLKTNKYGLIKNLNVIDKDRSAFQDSRKFLFQTKCHLPKNMFQQRFHLTSFRCYTKKLQSRNFTRFHFRTLL